MSPILDMDVRVGLVIRWYCSEGCFFVVFFLVGWRMGLRLDFLVLCVGMGE